MTGIKLTEKAAKEVLRTIEEQKLENKNLRVGVAGGGCSGFSYKLEFEDADKVVEKEDYLEEQHGVNVVVDKKSLLFLDGTTLDFHDDINARGFVFDNPQATKSCGCGNSFSA